jgi:molybdopterin synthase sulfur carrier subunit
MQKLTAGQGQIAVEGETVRQVIENLDAAYPGFKARICTEEDRIKPEIAVAVDGEVVTTGLRTKVGSQSEVHFLPALAGG